MHAVFINYYHRNRTQLFEKYNPSLVSKNSGEYKYIEGKYRNGNKCDKNSSKYW